MQLNRRVLELPVENKCHTDIKMSSVLACVKYKVNSESL